MNRSIIQRIPAPFWLLVLLLLSFGALIPWLGFYWDDWPVILTGKLLGAKGYQLFYQYDRPISAWTYIVTYPVFGDRPINWHVFSLLLRWGTSAALWWTLVRLWPASRREALWTSALFAIYPVFLQQYTSVAYSQHWICYLLFFLSLGFMVEAQRARGKSKARYGLFTVISMGLSLVQLLTMEYFAGLELLRPFLLWLLVDEKAPSWRKKSRLVLREWLPYLGVLALFTIWRIFLLKFPGEEANPPILLDRILKSPVSGGLRLFELVVQDSIHIMISVWANILNPTAMDLLDRFTLISWVWTIVFAAAVFLILRRRNDPQVENQDGTGQWPTQALVIGTAALLLGMLPVWFTDRQIIVGTYSNRFGLPAMLGASLIIIAMLEILVAKKNHRLAILAVLIGLAAGQHLRIANDYRWSWIRQTRFYWNLAWRAPGLEPETPVAAEGEIFPKVGLYSTAAAINLAYPPANDSGRLPYWFYSLGREYGYDMEWFMQGIPMDRKFRNYTFTGNSKDALIIFYQPDVSDCLSILSPDDFNVPDLPEISIQALKNSNLSRIQPDGVPGFPPEEIFGPEPEHGWCYLYEKAALAGQFERWDEVAQLGDQAKLQGYHPRRSDSDTAFEWLPFIEGYARTGRWEDARNLTIEAFTEDKRIDGRMCDLWEEIQLSQPDALATSQEVMDEIGCP
jgi:hypothetical protein